MFKLLRNLKWIDYLFLAIVAGLVGFQVWLDLELPDYMYNITQELGKIGQGLEVEMSVIGCSCD